MNCVAGEMAVIIGEDPGCECNIGATLTVVAPEPGTPEGYWGFCEVSRPLKMVDVEDRSECWVTDSKDERYQWIGVKDKYLLPIRDPGELPADGVLQPLEALA